MHTEIPTTSELDPGQEADKVIRDIDVSLKTIADKLAIKDYEPSIKRMLTEPTSSDQMFTDQFNLMIYTRLQSFRNGLAQAEGEITSDFDSVSANFPPIKYATEADVINTLRAIPLASTEIDLKLNASKLKAEDRIARVTSTFIYLGSEVTDSAEVQSFKLSTLVDQLTQLADLVMSYINAPSNTPVASRWGSRSLVFDQKSQNPEPGQAPVPESIDQLVKAVNRGNYSGVSGAEDLVQTWLINLTNTNDPDRVEKRFTLSKDLQNYHDLTDQRMRNSIINNIEDQSRTKKAKLQQIGETTLSNYLSSENVRKQILAENPDLASELNSSDPRIKNAAEQRYNQSVQAKRQSLIAAAGK